MSNQKNSNKKTLEEWLDDVNYDYLVNGEGEMFSDLPKTILDELCVQYDLSDFDRLLVEMYISLSPQERECVKNRMIELVDKTRDR